MMCVSAIRYSTFLKSQAARLACDRTGAMQSLEFAMVGPIFIGLLLSLFEMGILMAKIAMLDHAVAGASKFVYIGAAQGGAISQADIGTFICEKSVLFRDCEENITVELKPIADFSSSPDEDAECIDSNDDDALAPVVDYQTGAGSEVMFMRVCITTDVVTPGMGLGLFLKTPDTDRAQIISSTAFMNEPF